MNKGNIKDLDFKISMDRSIMKDQEEDPEHCRLYSILNIPRVYDTNALQSQSRLLLRAFHPDKATTDNGQPTFLQIKLAVDTLSDPIMKEAYDYGGMEAIQFIKNHANLYKLLSERKTMERRAILEHVLSEQLMRSQPSSNEVQVTGNTPIYSDNRSQRSEKSSLFVTWKQSISNRIKASFVSNGLVNLDFSSLFSLTFGKRLLFHTSRVLNGESLLKVTAGRTMASFRSLRTLHGTYLGTWGVDLGPQGTIRSILATVQTSVWKIRVALAEYFVKLSVNQFGFHGTAAWGLGGARYKIVRSYHIQESLELKYGLKMEPGRPLLPVFYLATPHLSLRIPVHGTFSSGWLLGLLVADGIESMGDKAIVSLALQRLGRRSKEPNGRYLKLKHIIRSVAIKKKVPLEVLQARFGSDQVDYSHWLQFWVRPHGELYLKTDDPRRAWLPATSGTIRYKIDGAVFEVTIQKEETLKLPSTIALMLGQDDIIV